MSSGIAVVKNYEENLRLNRNLIKKSKVGLCRSSRGREKKWKVGLRLPSPPQGLRTYRNSKTGSCQSSPRSRF